MTTDKEHAALEDAIERARRAANHMEADPAGYRNRPILPSGAATLRLLANVAEAHLSSPRVPSPTDHAAIDALAQRAQTIPRQWIAEIIRIINEPEKPKTKEIEVERWAVIDTAGICTGTFATVEGAHLHGKLTLERGGTIVRLTGKAEVPDV